MKTETTINQQLIFTNATIYVDADRKINNLLVENGKVKDYDVDPASYKDAKIVNLEGGFVYPGFNDSHVHPIEVGSMLEGVQVLGCRTSEEIAKVISELDKKTPEGELLIGNGFYPDDYDAWSHEDLKIIDQAAPNRPIFVFDQLGHNCIINSFAINKCGITAETPVPIGGKMIVKDGSPTGMLRETAMLLAGSVLLPMLSKPYTQAGSAQPQNISSSLTSTTCLAK